MSLKLLPFQDAGVSQIVSQRNTLLADEMGLGKTPQAVCAINRLKGLRKILIICPASVKLNWGRELGRWLKYYYDTYTVYGRRTLTPEILKNTEILIINFDIMVDYVDMLKEVRWDLKIIDECQYLTGRFAKRTQACLSIWSARNLFMSGTPAEIPLELWPILRHLDPDNWPSVFWDYAQLYCDPRFVESSFAKHGKWDFRGANNLLEIHEKLKNGIMIRRRKEDVLKDLRPKVRKIVHIDPDEQTEDYLAEERSTVGINYDEAIDEMYGFDTDLGDAIATTRREMGVSMVPFIIGYLEKMVKKHDKIVCGVFHKEVITLLEEYFGEACVSVNGDVGLKKREEYKKRFKDDPNCWLYLGQLQTMGTGTEGLQEIASLGVIAEMEWSFKTIVQFEDRIHRYGQKDTAEYHYLVVQGSLAEYMVLKLEGKKRNYNIMFDGRSQ